MVFTYLLCMVFCTYQELNRHRGIVSSTGKQSTYNCKVMSQRHIMCNCACCHVDEGLLLGIELHLLSYTAYMYRDCC